MGLKIEFIRNPVQVDSGVFQTQTVQVPGIGTGAAYASGDAFGSKITIPVPKSGTISYVVFLDLDNEGATKDLVLFKSDFVATADNAVFAPSSVDLVGCLGVITIDALDFANFSTNRIGRATPAFSYVAPAGLLYAQFVTRGGDNIAAGSLPQFFMVIV